MADGGSHEAAQQIAFADRILLNKIDLVTPEQIALVEARIRRINPMAPIVRTCKSEASASSLVAAYCVQTSATARRGKRPLCAHVGQGRVDGCGARCRIGWRRGTDG
jgi:G3E family GTPase